MLSLYHLWTKYYVEHNKIEEGIKGLKHAGSGGQPLAKFPTPYFWAFF